jgi:hypothetical protein
LSIRLAAASFIVSARSMTKTRLVASNGVRLAAATTGSSTSATTMSAAPVGRTHVRSGCTPSSAGARPPRDRRAVGEQPPAKARAAARLPAPAGPWKR